MPLTPTLPLPLSPSFSPTATHSIPFTSSHSIFLAFRWCDSMRTVDRVAAVCIRDRSFEGAHVRQGGNICGLPTCLRLACPQWACKDLFVIICGLLLTRTAAVLAVAMLSNPTSLSVSSSCYIILTFGNYLFLQDTHVLQPSVCQENTCISSTYSLDYQWGGLFIQPFDLKNSQSPSLTPRIINTWQNHDTWRKIETFSYLENNDNKNSSFKKYTSFLSEILFLKKNLHLMQCITE